MINKEQTTDSISILENLKSDLIDIICKINEELSKCNNDVVNENAQYLQYHYDKFESYLDDSLNALEEEQQQ